MQLRDGLIINDTQPTEVVIDNEIQKTLVNKKTSMSWLTAIKLSFKNLMTKKKRTIMTAIAGSIGIIGVALVLAISSGMTTYINGMQSDALSGFPLTISQVATASGGFNVGDFVGNSSESQEFLAGNTIFSHEPTSNIKMHTNIITPNYIDYLKAMDPSLYNAISYSHGLEMTVVAKTDNGLYKKISTGGGSSIFGSSSYFNEIPNNEDFIKSQYDILEKGGTYPSGVNEVALIVDNYNRLDVRILDELGIKITENYKFSDLLGRTFKVIHNNDYYKESAGIFVAGTDYEAMYNNPNSITLTISGILRVKESSSSNLLSSGIGYTTALTDTMLDNANTSNVAVAQVAAGDTMNVLTGQEFNNFVTLASVIRQIGADTLPTGIQIYPSNFDAKEKINSYLDAYNVGLSANEQIIYSDLAESMTSMISTMINTITVVLTAFAAISLVVSTIMIGIITYVSVVERTKEIGILRAIGARKKDISRIFNAETLIIGFIAGVLGVVVTLLLSIPINMVISNLVGVSGIANLPILYGIILILGNMMLTLIGGLIPAKGAAKKDPVVALRTE